MTQKDQASHNIEQLIFGALERAQGLLDNGQIDTAIEELEGAYQLSPDLAGDSLARALLRRAGAQQTAGDASEALATYQRAALVAPHDNVKDDLERRISDLTQISMANPSVCPNCRKAIEPDWVSCPFCKLPLNTESRNPSYRKDNLERADAEDERQVESKKPIWKNSVWIAAVMIVVFVSISYLSKLGGGSPSSNFATLTTTSILTATPYSTPTPIAATFSNICTFKDFTNIIISGYISVGSSVTEISTPGFQGSYYGLDFSEEIGSPPLTVDIEIGDGENQVKKLMQFYSPINLIITKNNGVEVGNNSFVTLFGSSGPLSKAAKLPNPYSCSIYVDKIE